MILGLCGGLSIITRATFLLFFAASCFWLVFVMRRDSFTWIKIIWPITFCVIGFLIIIIPVSTQSYRITGIFSPLPETGPLNLYIGNNAERSEIMAVRPGGEWEEVMLFPIREGFRTKREAQHYFLRRVENYIITHPVHFMKRLGRKTVHYFSSRELPNNSDLYANRKYSPLLACLMWKTHHFGFPFGVLLFLIIGLIRCWRSIPTVIKLFLFLYAASIILVFVTSRYRAPMIPVMAVIAAAGFWNIVDTVRARHWTLSISLIIAIFIITIVTSIARALPLRNRQFQSRETTRNRLILSRPG